MKITITAIVLMMFTNALFSQIRLKPDVIAEAEKLKVEYPKEKFISTHSTETYGFEIGKETVICNEVFEERIMSLKEDLTFSKRVFFNEETEIRFVKRKNYKKKIIQLNYSTAKYKSDGIFYDDASVAFFRFFLTTRGDNSTYKVGTRYRDVKYVTKSFFHNYYPVKKAQIIYNIPDWLELELVEVNFEGYDIEKTEIRNEKEKTTQVTFTILNCEALKGGSYSIGAVQQIPHILVLSKSYKRNGREVSLFSSTQDLYDWYASLVKKTENNPEIFRDKVEELTKNDSTDLEKVKSIFYWVQDNTRYIAYEDGIMGFKPANADDVYTKKYGDCKGMANLTCSMLKLAGFDARLTWIGTKSIPYTYATPSLAVDNHMITTVFLDDKRYFLDATEKGVAIGEYAYRIQGQDVLIEDGNKYILDSVPEFGNSYNLKKNHYDLKYVDNALVGSAYEEFHGEEKVRLYRNIYKVSKSDLFERARDFVGNFDKNMEITDLKISNFKDRSEPIKFEYNINIQNRITEVENEMYFNLEFEKTYASLKVEENRNLGYDFHQKVYKNQVVNLIIPEGYKVDYFPKDVVVDNDEFTFNVKYSFDEATNTIKYSKLIIIKNGIISHSNFTVWDESIKKLKEIYSDQVILIKN